MKLNTFANIRELPRPKDILFACALMQRMLPSYQLFCKNHEFGDPLIAESVLDLIWEWCATPKNKFNASVQAEKIEEITPDVANFDSFGVYPALDFCMALSSTLQAFTLEHEKPAVTVAKLSQGSVEAFILASAEELSVQEVKQDPLMVFEIETQKSLLSYCHANKMNKVVVQQLKSDLLAQNPSNLGLEPIPA